MKTIKYLFLLILISVFNGCDDYLDVEPKGFTIPKTIKDYDLLLNGGSYDNILVRTGNENALFFSADDFVEQKKEDLGNIEDINNINIKFYTWSSDLYKKENYLNGWVYSYKNIYTFNKVINNIDNAERSPKYTEKDRKRIWAEAKTGRAYDYWMLVNTFAKQYSKANASSLGVPLVLQANTTAKVPKRSTVKEVYDFIIKETEEAIPYLPKKRINNIRYSKGAGYAFLARYYLFMGNYQKAKENATKALEEENTIGDYITNFKNAYVSEQYTNRHYGMSFGFTKGKLSDDLKDSYESSDFRLKTMFTNCEWKNISGNWEKICGENYRNSYSVNINNAVSIPEMYLIRAECNARLTTGVISDVVKDLNRLREKRISPYTPLTIADFTSKDDALIFVLAERRREMVMTGIRLFDLKRLNLEPRFQKTITHIVDGKTYTLKPNANNYVLPIPIQVINFNPQMKQNPRD